MPTAIPSQRHLFDLPDDVAYLNCAYMSPLLHSVVAAGREAVGMKARPWEITTPDFFGIPETARELFARLIHARTEDICIVPAASYGIATAAANLPVARGQKLIVLADQFPSNVYSWRQLAGDVGATLETLPRTADGNWTPAILEAINERTAVVALPHCHWTDGGLIDLVAVGKACRRVGAALALDLTQSIGALPFDVNEVQPAFAVAAGYKWMMGPYSLGFMYVAPEYQAGRPLEHNWIARAGSEDFARLVDYRMDFQPGARRFDVGEVANFALLPQAVAALEQLHAWGVDNIQHTLSATTEAIATRASNLGLTASDAAYRAGHFLGLRFPDGVPEGLLPKLADEKVYVSVRGDSMRVTPHLYNTEPDVDRLLDALHKVL
ncbi:MAG: aminotransferase class V-fold PLP-dependent enzyme [Alphaproteobacteria bacterium]